MKDIYESEMKFGSFSEMDLFEIEKSQLLKKLGKGIKSVEFILLNKKRNIIFLEAKKTCPNENNMHQTKEKKKNSENIMIVLQRSLQNLCRSIWQAL